MCVCLCVYLYASMQCVWVCVCVVLSRQGKEQNIFLVVVLMAMYLTNYSDLPVFVNHIHHLINFTLVWKMSSTITEIIMDSSCKVPFSDTKWTCAVQTTWQKPHLDTVEQKTGMYHYLINNNFIQHTYPHLHKATCMLVNQSPIAHSDMCYS